MRPVNRSISEERILTDVSMPLLFLCRSRSRLLCSLREAAIIALLVFSTSRGLLGLDPSKQIDQYAHENWNWQHGLPGDAVYQVLQSPDGYLWIRSSAGLVRFDGVQFTLIDSLIGDGPVKAIALGTQNELFLRTNSRTLIYKNKGFSDYLSPGSLPDGGIRTLFEDKAHEMLLGSDDFVYLLKNSAVQMLVRGAGHVDAFAEDHAGNVWVGAAFALYKCKQGRLTRVLSVQGAKAISALLVDHKQDLWVGTWDGLYRKAGDQAVLNRVLPNDIHGHIQALLEDQEGNLWIGTDTQGLLRLTAGQVTAFNASDGLSDNKVLSLYEDREESLWVGTGSGLDHFRNAKVTTLTTKEGLPSNDTRAAFETRDGELFVFSIPGGLARIKNDRVFRVTNDRHLDYQGNGVFEDKDGSLWMGTLGGLTKFKNGKFTVYDPGGTFSKHLISSISEDDESLIVTTSEPIALRFKDGKVSPFTIHGRETPLTSRGNYTITTYRDSSGTLWFGTVQGLFKFASGEPPMQARQSQIDFSVTSISDDHQGNLWLGGRLPGITRFRIRDEKVTHYGQREGLFDDFPSRILFDDAGNLWISTSNGIYRADRRDLDDFADGRISKVHAVVFGTEDGMKTGEANLVLSQPAGWRTSDGKLWFTTTKGIVAIDPKHIRHNGLIPPVIIEGVILNDREKLPGNNARFPPGMNKIEIHYTALSLLVPNRVKFRYMLEGYDQGWVDADSRRAAYYTNLAPGGYRFRVIACNDDGVWNEQGAEVSFTLEPHYYQTDWFYAMCASALATGIVFLLRFNTRRLRRRAEELKRLVGERTKKLQEEVEERKRAEEAAVQARESMRFQATHDALTSFLNRGAILEELSHELARVVSDRESIVVLMADLDHFKSVNDQYGHMVGDQVLQSVASRLLKSVRSVDHVGRYGGEEFLVVLANCDSQSALERAEDLRKAVESSPVETSSGSLQVTVSIGVLAIEQSRRSSRDEILREVDLALYAAKDAGRNCCFMAGADSRHVSPI